MPDATFRSAVGAIALVAIGVLPTRAADKPVTFANQVVRILQDECQDWHRACAVAPMPLINLSARGHMMAASGI